MGRSINGKMGTYGHTIKGYYYEWESDDSKKKRREHEKVKRAREKMLYENNRYGISGGEKARPFKKYSKDDVSDGYRKGMAVVHVKYGSGVIIDMYSSKIKVKFDNRERGHKDFDRKHAWKENLVVPVSLAVKRAELRKK